MVFCLYFIGIETFRRIKEKNMCVSCYMSEKITDVCRKQASIETTFITFPIISNKISKQINCIFIVACKTNNFILN